MASRIWVLGDMGMRKIVPNLQNSTLTIVIVTLRLTVQMQTEGDILVMSMMTDFLISIMKKIKTHLNLIYLKGIIQQMKAV